MCAKTAHGIQIVVWIRDDYEAVSTITKEWKRKWLGKGGCVFANQ